MKKNNNKEIMTCLYIVIGLLILNTIFLFILISRDNTGISNSNTNTNGSASNDDTYDISSFEQKTPAEITAMIKNKEEFVLFFGQSSCGYCKKMLPTVKSAQEKYKFKTVYLDISTAGTTSSAYQEMSALLDVEVTGNGETKAFGKFAVTPMIAVLSNGKMVDGMIGYDSYDNFVKFLNEAGIK